MSNFAVLSGDVVSNIIVADSLEIAEAVTGSICIEYTNENPAGVNFLYNKETKTFTGPVNTFNNIVKEEIL